MMIIAEISRAIWGLSIGQIYTKLSRASQVGNVAAEPFLVKYWMKWHSHSFGNNNSLFPGETASQILLKILFGSSTATIAIAIEYLHTAKKSKHLPMWCYSQSWGGDRFDNSWNKKPSRYWSVAPGNLFCHNLQISGIVTTVFDKNACFTR